MRTINNLLLAALAAATISFDHSTATEAKPAFMRGYQYQSRPAISDNGKADYLDEIADEGIYRWNREKLPVKVFIEDGSAVPGYRSIFRKALVESFNLWSQYSAGRLGWLEVADKSKADIVCGWSEEARENDRGTEVGRTKTFTRFDPATNTGTIQRATMDLLTHLPERELTDQEVEKAYLHEVGHAFGLAGHSPQRSDIMAAALNSSQRVELSARDVNTINRLYAGYGPITTAVHPVGDLQRL